MAPLAVGVEKLKSHGAIADWSQGVVTRRQRSSNLAPEGEAIMRNNVMNGIEKESGVENKRTW